MASEQMMMIANIEATQATQVRAKLDKGIIDQYQEDLENGADFPAIVVFAEKGSARFILADGFHRLLAHVNAGIEMIKVDVHVGGMHEALMYALSANTRHGLRRSNADKVNAVKMAMKDPKLRQLTQQEIADICGVSRKTVQRTAQKEKPDAGQNGTESQEPEANKPENNRPTKAEPTQDEIDRGEIRQAIALVKGLPYPGEDSAKLKFDGDDVEGLEYMSAWAAHAFLAARGE